MISAYDVLAELQAIERKAWAEYQDARKAGRPERKVAALSNKWDRAFEQVETILKLVGRLREEKEGALERQAEEHANDDDDYAWRCGPDVIEHQWQLYHDTMSGQHSLPF